MRSKSIFPCFRRLIPGSTTPQHSATTTSTGDNHTLGGTTSHNDSGHSAHDSYDQDDVSDGEDEICVVDERPDSPLIAAPVPITCHATPDSHSGKEKNYPSNFYFEKIYTYFAGSKQREQDKRGGSKTKRLCSVA